MTRPLVGLKLVQFDGVYPFGRTCHRPQRTVTVRQEQTDIRGIEQLHRAFRKDRQEFDDIEIVDEGVRELGEYEREPVVTIIHLANLPPASLATPTVTQPFADVARP